MQKKHIILPFIFCLFFFCSYNVNQGRIYPDGDIVKIKWDTFGGGDILFEITENDSGYDINVLRKNFLEMDTLLILTNIYEQSYIIIQDIFNKKKDLYNETYHPVDPVGTWTSINLYYSGSEEVIIKNIYTHGDLRYIRNFVEDNIGEIE